MAVVTLQDDKLFGKKKFERFENGFENRDFDDIVVHRNIVGYLPVENGQ
jgi:hypothetical protein